MRTSMCLWSQRLWTVMADVGLTLSAAESCTGVLLWRVMTTVPGSASMFAGWDCVLLQ